MLYNVEMKRSGFTMVESLAALAITAFLLLMVVGNAVTVQKNQRSILQHQQGLLAIASEADVIRAHHRYDLTPGVQLPFFTSGSLPGSLANVVGVITVEEEGSEGCLHVKLKLSWGVEVRSREELHYVLCR